jgi:putative uncharacterized protein SCO5329
MTEQRYTASRKAIGELLSTARTRIEVPEWQRSYSWEKEHFEAFWLDIINFDSLHPQDTIKKEEYFLGAAVLVTGSEVDLLLDGQQRLATATILLSSLRDALAKYNTKADTRLQAKHIADYDDHTEEVSPALTLNYYDRDYFRSEIQDDSKSGKMWVQVKYKSHERMRAARKYFDERISEEGAKCGGGNDAYRRILRIKDVLLNHVSLVVIESSDEDNAATVFETLNDRGIGLSTSDLLRNFLLRTVPRSKREEVVSAWGSILETAGESSSKDFLRHFWVSQRGDVKSRRLYREIKDTILAENINPLTFSRQLSRGSHIYQDLVHARDDDEDVQRLLGDIKQLNARMLYPALLSGKMIVLDGTSTDEPELTGFFEFVSALLTIFVRHSVVGKRDASELEGVVYSVAVDLRKNKSFDEAVATLRKASPSSQQFQDDFAKVAFKLNGRARYILRELEHAKRKTQEVAVEIPSRVHVEHIYPKTPLQGREFPNHEDVVYRLGNLTLLGKGINVAIKNSSFEEKRLKYKDSDILMTRELLKWDTWTESSIDERQRQLAELAVEIWKFPSRDA